MFDFVVKTLKNTQTWRPRFNGETVIACEIVMGI